MNKHIAARNGRLVQMLAACIIAALVLIAAIAFVGTPKAEAWAGSSTVTMSGTVTHAGGWAGSGWLYYRTSDGDCGYAWLGSGTLYGKPYSFTLRNVPFMRSTWVSISAGGSGWSHCGGFGVSRPSFGTNCTRNVYWP